MTALVFWGSLALILYGYLGYPCALALRARLAPRPVRKRRFRRWAPGVSIIVAARNEAQLLASRIENLFALAYPGPKQIIIVSDGSTDGTPRTLARYSDRIELVEIPASGKAAALNAGVARARYDILVFADARQAFASDALNELVANFSDPTVGGVSGELVLDCEHDPPAGGNAGASSVGEGVGLYWRYEKWIRRHESLVHSMLGATGAIYAMRRSLWRPLPPGTLLDDVLAPMRVVLQGHRVIFDDRARAHDRVAVDAPSEHRRKVRTLAGNYQVLRLEPQLLNPFRNPVWLQYVSHKILVRLIVPYALIAWFLSSALLATDGFVYTVAFAAQVGFYGLAAYGAALAATAASSRERNVCGSWPLAETGKDAVR
jgi:biofilm PGA synthesis N-glycosyltransferase PgaC